MALGERLREIRKTRKGWTLQRLADAAKIPQATLWRIEKGLIKNPKMDMLLRLATALEISVDDLLGSQPRQLMLDELFADDSVGQAVFRGDERLPARRREELLHFVQFLEQQERQTGE